MLKIQQLLLNLLMLIAFMVVILLVIQNLDTAINFRFLVWDTTRLPSLPLGILFLMVCLLTSLGIACKMTQGILALQHQGKQKHRELERHQVSLTSAEDQVKVLEAKVKTLEKALSESLNASTEV
jgi:uncharacterized integral membrane protein